MTDTTVDTDNINGTESTDSIEQTVEQADAKVVELQSQLEKQTKLVEKLRQQEKHNQQLAKDAGARNLEDALKNIANGFNKEVDEWKTKYESINQEYSIFKEKVQSQQIDTVLKDALQKSGAKDLNTTLKVVDKSKIQWDDQGEVDTASIESLVEGLKQSDPILFDVPAIPTLKVAGEGNPIGGYEKDLAACKSQKEIVAVMKKYGKM